MITVYSPPIEWVTANAKRHAVELYEALKDLVEDTQHVNHNCGDRDCPVRKALRVLNKVNSLGVTGQL